VNTPCAWGALPGYYDPGVLGRHGGNFRFTRRYLSGMPQALLPDELKKCKPVRDMAVGNGEWKGDLT